MRSLLAVAVGLLFVGLWFVLKLWPNNRSASFSQHVAKNKHATFFYFVLFAITGSLLLWFFMGWLVPTYSLPVGFTVLVAISIALQIACTLVPENGGQKTKIHRVLAGASGLLLLPLEWFVFTSLPPSNTVRFLFIGSMITQITIVFYLALRRRLMGWPWQSAYYLVFFVPLLALSYL